MRQGTDTGTLDAAQAVRCHVVVACLKGVVKSTHVSFPFTLCGDLGGEDAECCFLSTCPCRTTSSFGVWGWEEEGVGP